MARHRMVVIAVLAALAFSATALQAQPEAAVTPEVRSIVKDLETALFSASLKGMSGRFGRQVFVNLKGGESGYFSSNQAPYVVEEYFAGRKVIGLRFSATQDRESSAFATGSGTIKYRGSVQQLQVFVSFVRLDGRWVITQLNVY
jgi:hypothetical protein